MAISVIMVVIGGIHPPPDHWYTVNRQVQSHATFTLQVLQYSLQLPPIFLVWIFEPVHEKGKGCMDIIFALADTNSSYATG